MMIKGALFDVDGTLLDSMSIWDELGNRYLQSLGKIPEENLSQILFPMTLEQSSSYLKERYKISKESYEIQRDLVSILETFYKEEVPLKPGVLSCLENLKAHDIPMGIVTIGDMELVKMAFSRLHIDSYFQFLLTCESYQTTKYEPLIYQKACESLHLPCSSVVVFEDVLHAITSAKKAGCYVVGVEDQSSQKDQEKIVEIADEFVEDLSQFQL